MRPPIVVCLAGPTAAGKTGWAVSLARHLPLSIVSVDSAMVFRGMDIGTGKPDATVLAAVPHRLIDMRDPWQGYSAGEFRADALAAIEAVLATGRTPLLVGGAMLYFRALLDGLSPLPTAAPAVRAELDARAAEVGWPALHEELARIDPPAAARIGPGDRQRIQRALEVHRLTGRPISTLQGQREAPVRFRFIRIALLPAVRQDLHERIAQRLMAMLDAGFIDEVAALRALPQLTAGHPSMRAVGYRQLWQYLDGACSRDEAIAGALAATRQLARRQLTWLRREAWDFELDMTAPDPVAEIRAVMSQAGCADALSGATG